MGPTIEAIPLTVIVIETVTDSVKNQDKRVMNATLVKEKQMTIFSRFHSVLSILIFQACVKDRQEAPPSRRFVTNDRYKQKDCWEIRFLDFVQLLSK